MAQKPFDHGLMELTHREIVAYGVGQKNPSLLELELLLRLEQILDARDQFVSNLVTSACARCKHLQSLIPTGIDGEPAILSSEVDTWQ